MKNKKINNVSTNEEQKYIYKFPNNFSEYEKKLIIKIHEKFYNKVLNDFVALDFIYTTLWQESGGYILKDVPNQNIIGDNGNSIGYFQIYKFGAFLEVNERENKNYSFNDLKDEKINIWFGIKYLSYCLNSALRQTNKKPLAWLLAKKYNGGLDETENSNNIKAQKYAEGFYLKYLKVKEFIKLNLVK